VGQVQGNRHGQGADQDGDRVGHAPYANGPGFPLTDALEQPVEPNGGKRLGEDDEQLEDEAGSRKSFLSDEIGQRSLRKTPETANSRYQNPATRAVRTRALCGSFMRWVQRGDRGPLAESGGGVFPSVVR
jgi:hypothetical protein